MGSLIWRGLWGSVGRFGLQDTKNGEVYQGPWYGVLMFNFPLRAKSLGSSQGPDYGQAHAGMPPDTVCSRGVRKSGREGAGTCARFQGYESVFNIRR